MKLSISLPRIRTEAVWEGGREEEGALFPRQPSVSSRISIRLPRKTTFGSASLAVWLNRFSAAARLQLQQDGNEPFFIIYVVFYVTSDSIVNTWIKVKINSNYIPVQVTHFKVLPVIKAVMDCK